MNSALMSSTYAHSLSAIVFYIQMTQVLPYAAALLLAFYSVWEQFFYSCRSTRHYILGLSGNSFDYMVLRPGG